jgi:putative ABC transport system substrate-binding protein
VAFRGAGVDPLRLAFRKYFSRNVVCGRRAARTLGLQFAVVNARTDSDLETAFATFSQQHVGAVLIGISGFYTRRTEQLAALAARHALPAMSPYREVALAGGLMSYGSSLRYAFHHGLVGRRRA